MEEYWVSRKCRRIRNVCRDATKPTPSPQVSQTKTQQSTKSSLETDTCWASVIDRVCLKARPRKMTQHSDFQKAVNCFLPFYSSGEICMSTKAGPAH